MKTLYLLRHAKSSWANSDLSDFERPLKSRGLEDATFIGTLIFQNQIKPDVILSSPAKRAKQTAILVRETGQLEKPIQYEERIYEASPILLLQILFGVEDSNESVFMVGHNPGFEQLINLLTGESIDLPTAGFAKISLHIDSWSEIDAGRGKLELFASPILKKEL